MVVEQPQEQTTRKGISVTKLLISIVACEAIGGIGSIFTFGAIPTWYSALQKPSFTPPNWLFAPVWTTLFLLMGISLYLIWRERSLKSSTTLALFAFGSQLALNVLWSAVFFGLHQIFFGLVEILVLWAAIAFTIVVAYRVSHAAAYLLVPYIAWVTIATLLNYSVWILNV